MPTEAKSFALSSVMVFTVPAANVAAPVTVNAPISVIGPAVETLSMPLTVLAASEIEF